MPASRGLAAAASTIVFSVLATLFVIARLIARVQIIKNAGADELTIVVSLVAAIVLTVLTCEQVRFGLGKHIDDVPTEDLMKMTKSLWIGIVFYNSSLGLTKISIVLQYLRVFIGTRIRLACWFTIAVVFAYAMWAIFSNIFSCSPIPRFWNQSIPGHCLERKVLWFFNASFNILTDLIILILPMPVISSLKLPRKQKFGLMAIFAVGGLVCLVSVARLHSLFVLSESNDISWDNTDAAIWSSMEIHVGIICASLPTLKPVVSWLFPRMLSSNHSTAGAGVDPSHNNQSTFHSRSQFRSTHIPLYDMGSPAGPTTVVEARKECDDRDEDNDRLRKGRSASKEIFVTMAVTQDVESKSEMGSEKDLIFQR